MSNRRLLHDVSGEVKPGEVRSSPFVYLISLTCLSFHTMLEMMYHMKMVAILGPSGAGSKYISCIIFPIHVIENDRPVDYTPTRSGGFFLSSLLYINTFALLTPLII
jgi:hypothetical protein